MLLRIQRDESLHSYIERNIVLNWMDPVGEFFKAFSKSSFYYFELKTIASAMGWPGCRGLNRLLHFHTDYAKYSVFKDDRNLSYSQDAYISKSWKRVANKFATRFCPDCVREDIRTIGFSFWHRSQDQSVDVCAKHNVILESNCPFCNSGFDSREHGLEIMWNGCGGHSLAECESVTNHDPIKYKESKLLSDIYSCTFHISTRASFEVFYNRLSSIDHSHLLKNQYYDNYRSFLKLATSSKHTKYINTEEQFMHNRSCFDLIMSIYDNFDGFLNEVKCHVNALRPIDSLWGTYKTRDKPIFNYVIDEFR